MNTPKNTKSEEIKQQVTKVGVMKTDKKIDCYCHCHRKSCVYEGIRHKCMNQFSSCEHCTPQEQKSVDDLLLWVYNHGSLVTLVSLESDSKKQEFINRVKSELTKLLTDAIRLPDNADEHHVAAETRAEIIKTIERKLSE